MKFSLIHPSYQRPVLAFNMLSDVYKKAQHPTEVEIIVSLSAEDKFIPQYQQMFKDAHNVQLDINSSVNYVQAVNNVHKKTTGDVIIISSDDFVFPDIWDRKLIEAINIYPQFEDDYAIAITDGVRDDKLLTIPMCSRKYMERNPWFFYPEYHSMASDRDFTAMAYKLGRVVEARHLLFKHNHFSVGRAPKDDTYMKQNAPEKYRVGDEVYNKRKANNFGLGDIGKNITWKDGY